VGANGEETENGQRRMCMTRFDILTSEAMSDEQRALTEENQAAGGRLRGGPYWAYLYDPELMRKQMALNDHVRDSSLDKRVRQIAIMTTVRFWNSEYPWGVQARLAHELGVDAAIIDAINTGERPKFDDSRQAAAYEVASELLAKKRLSDELYAKAQELFGLETLIHLVTCIGFYSMHSCTANAFDLVPQGAMPIPLKT
jgi:4-carboxymuconolactone decarboxylase